MSDPDSVAASIERYKHLRACSRELFDRLITSPQIRKFDPTAAGRKLTVPTRDGSLVFDSETESTALIDFFLHEFRVSGQRPIDACDPVAMKLSPDQHALLEAHRQSRASLFQPVAVDPRACLIQMRDLLAPALPDVYITDLNCSQTGPILAALTLFLRVVTCQGIQMSSGFFFTFRPAYQQMLLRNYQARMATVPDKLRSERTFVFFYQRHREFGEKQEYRDVC